MDRAAGVGGDVCAAACRRQARLTPPPTGFARSRWAWTDGHFRRGGTSGYRLILVGIAIGILMLSITDYLLPRARIEEAEEATRWLLGSLNARGWRRRAAAHCARTAAAGHGAGRACLRALELGDDAAQALGVHVERARLTLMALAVALVSVSVVAVGPIGFVALTAPQIAARPHLRTAAAVLGAHRRGGRARRGYRRPALDPLDEPARRRDDGGFGGLYLAWPLTME